MRKLKPRDIKTLQNLSFGMQPQLEGQELALALHKLRFYNMILDNNKVTARGQLARMMYDLMVYTNQVALLCIAALEATGHDVTDELVNEESTVFLVHQDMEALGMMGFLGSDLKITERGWEIVRQLEILHG